MNDTDQATFMDLLTNFMRVNEKSAKENLSGSAGELKAWFVRVGVGTSTGDTFESRVDKSLRTSFLEMAKK